MSRSSLSSLRGGGQHGGAGPLGELDGGDADAAGAGLDQDGLARLQPAELEQAVVGGAERDRDAGGLLDRQAVGHRPAERAGTARSSACEPSRPTVTTRSPSASPSTADPAATTVPAAW